MQNYIKTDYMFFQVNYIDYILNHFLFKFVIAKLIHENIHLLIFKLVKLSLKRFLHSFTVHFPSLNLNIPY